MKNFEGRVAVITGGGSGIGRAIGLGLARRGVNVVVADVELDAAEAVASEISEYGVRALPFRVDVAHRAEIEALADAAYAEFGKVDLLFNHAGVNFRPFRTIWDTSEADLKWIIDVNIWGVVNGVHVFVPRMMEQEGDKHIINTSSMAPMIKAFGSSAYTMTKAAVDSFSEMIQLELAHENIGVTILQPGRVATNVANSVRLRPADEQEANAKVRGVIEYLADKGQGSEVASGPAGSEAVLIDADDVNRVIQPDEAAEIIIAAIEENRLYCTTHRPPEKSINDRAAALKDAYRAPRPPAT